MKPIARKNGRYALGGAKDTDLEGIDDEKYNVFTEEDKLAEARQRYPKYNWFASYTITDKQDKAVGNLPEYTIEFDRPDAETFELYYYLEGSVHRLQPEETKDKGNKKRVKARLSVGDPPTGTVP
jgi:hypothetical protein